MERESFKLSKRKWMASSIKVQGTLRRIIWEWRRNETRGEGGFGRAFAIFYHSSGDQGPLQIQRVHP